MLTNRPHDLSSFQRFFDAAQRTIDHFYQHYALEKALLRSHWRGFLFAICFQYVHILATNVVYYLHEPQTRLYDLGFSVIPPLTPQQQIISEYLFFCLLTFVVCFMLSPFFVAYTRPKYTVIMLSRFVRVLVVAQTLRMLSFLSTILPAPNYHCQPDSTEYAPPRTLRRILLRADAFKGCGDLIFSSHTMFVVLFTLTYVKYGELTWLKKLLAVYVFTFGALVAAARKHYSIDIVLAIYTVPLLWTVLDHYFPDVTPQTIANITAKSTHKPSNPSLSANSTISLSMTTLAVTTACTTVSCTETTCSNGLGDADCDSEVV